MHVLKVIEQFGYKGNEARIYLISLAMGEATISEIAEKAKLPRTSVQMIVDKLHKDGLMNFFIKKRYKRWMAENPEKLLIRIREQEAALKSVLPELAAMRHDRGGRPTIKVFVGEDDIKRILDDIIATKHHVLALISWDDWINFFGKEYISDFIQRRKSHFLNIKLLTPKTAAAIKVKSRDNEELRQTKFWPQDIKIENMNFIYGNKVALISLNKVRPTGVVIEDEDIKNTMTVFFNQIWKISE